MTQMPEPHRLDGGEMPKSWYIEAWIHSYYQNRALREENQRLRKILRRLHKLSDGV